jgi:hypothetical protein
MAVTDDLPLTLGRNLLSLTYESDITDRASRIAPIALPLGGEATLLGFARWAISAPDSDAKTFVALDPAGGAGPVGFGTGSGDPTIDQLIGWYVLLERTGESFAIVSTDAETQTIALATWSANLLAGERFQFRLTAPGTTFAPYTFRFGGVQIPIQDAEVSDLDGDVITVRDGWNSSFTPIATDNQHVGRSVRLSEFVGSDNITGFDATGGVYTYSFADVSAYQVGDWMRRLVSATAPYGDSLSPRFPAAMTIVDVDTDANTVTVVSRDGRNRVITDDIGIGFVGARIYRPTATLRTIIASSGSAHTLTLDETTGFSIAGGLGAVEILIAETTSSGKVPWFLEHPTYVQPYPTGIGVKFRTIDRTQAPTAYLGVQNLVTNGVPNTWTTETELPDGYLAAFTIAFGSGAPGVAAPSFMTVAKNLDPLYIKAGKQSLFFSTTRGVLYFPPIPWTPMYAGQRFSVRVPLFLTRWENTSLIQLLLGIVESDGTVRPWYDQARTVLIQPASASSPRADPPYHKFAANVWDDLVLNDFDITEPSTQPIVLRPTATDIAHMGGGRGLVALLAINDVGGTGGATVEGYVGGIAIVQGHEAPPNVQEYYEANKLHQDTNTVLKRLAPTQFTISVDFHDAKRLNPTLDEPDATRGVVGLFNEPSLGIVNVRRRITDVVRNMVVPGETRITASPPRTTLAAATAPRPATTPPPITSGGGGTTPGGSTMPTIVLSVAMSGAVPVVTATVSDGVDKVVFYATFVGEPSADDVRTLGVTRVSRPFQYVAAAIPRDDIEYIGAIAYANGVESAIARTTATFTARDGSTLYPIVGAKLWMELPIRGEKYVDAGITLATTSGQSLRQWNDVSGNNRHATQPDSAHRPTLDTTMTHDGNPTSRFDGNAWLELVDMSALNGQHVHVFIAFKTDNDPAISLTDGGLCYLGGESVFESYVPSGDGNIYLSVGSVERVNFGNPSTSLSGQFNVLSTDSFTGAVNGEGFSAYLNGTQLSGGPLLANIVVFPSAPLLGAMDDRSRPSPRNFLVGNIAGFAVVVGSLTSDEIAAIVAALLAPGTPTEPPPPTVSSEAVMILKGSIEASTNPEYPAADAGHVYEISVAGRIGGASGVIVQPNDTIYCLTDGTAAGDQATVGDEWVVLHANPVGTEDSGRWEPLTTGDPDNPELIFLGGDVVMVFVPAS